MKQWLCLVCVVGTMACALWGQGGLDEVYQVTVAVQGRSYGLQEMLETEAKKRAIVMYMQRHEAFQDVRVLQEAANEYGRFVRRYLALGASQWLPLGADYGQLQGTFQVELDVAAINRWLQARGLSNQVGIDLVIMEEPPSMGQMRIYGEARNYMITNYTLMQRAVRDAIIQKVGHYGFDIMLLEDQAAYAPFKDRDQGLMGTYYDATDNRFVIHQELLNAIRGNSPDAFVILYRLDALIWDEVAQDVRSTVSVNVKNLRTGVTRHFGRAVLQVPTSGHSVEKVFDDLSNCVTLTVRSLFDREEAGRKLNELIMGMKNQRLLPGEPIRLTVNGDLFPLQVRKRSLYTVKRILLQGGITLGQPTVTGTCVTASVNPARIADPQQLVYDFLLPAMKANFDIEIMDQQIDFNGNSVLINSGGANR